MVGTMITESVWLLGFIELMSASPFKNKVTRVLLDVIRFIRILRITSVFIKKTYFHSGTERDMLFATNSSGYERY